MSGDIQHIKATFYAMLPWGGRVWMGTGELIHWPAEGVVTLPSEAVNRTSKWLVNYAWSYSGKDLFDQGQLPVENEAGVTTGYWVWREPETKKAEGACKKCGRQGKFKRTALVCPVCPGELIGGF